MKILHTSDWHIGAAEGNRSLKEDQNFFLSEIYRIIDLEEVDVVVIAGDVYDRALTNAEAIRIYDDAMTHICIEMGKKVVIIAGNHDSAERLSSCSNLLEQAGLYICGAIQKEPTIVPIGDVDFYMLPWFSEDKVKSLYPEEIPNIKSLTDAYKIVCDKCRATFREGRKHIAVSHAFISGSELSSSDRAAELAVVGFATQVSAEVFNGFDYVALGHIHKPQDITETIRYSGTPMPYSFGKEESQEKSVTIIDTDTMDKKIVPLELLHKRITIEDTLDNIMNGSYPDEVVKGYVRLHVTDSFLGLERSAALQTVFNNILEMTGTVLSDENAVNTMTLNEFRNIEDDPVQIFKAFYQDNFGEEANEHYLELFRQCLAEFDEADGNS